MASANKTQPTDASVDAFLEGVSPDRRRDDARVILDLMCRVTGLDPMMWGANIVGFGRYHYRYKSGHEGDWPRTGFSPRKTSLSIYIMPGFDDCRDLLAKLGKHKTSVSCLYITNLANVDLEVLEQIIRHGFDKMAQLYPD